MTKANTNFKQGFTIIEVVLVLAIAGLIFLMVFVALPNLQRSQRDTQRRDDYAALASNITAYISNNNGRLPSVPAAAAGADANNSAQWDASVYINSTGKSADGEYYELILLANTEAAINAVLNNPISGQAKTATAVANIPNKADENANNGTLALAAGTETTKVYIVPEANCGGTYADGSSKPQHMDANAGRHFAIYGALETGSYCQAE